MNDDEIVKEMIERYPEMATYVKLLHTNQFTLLMHKNHDYGPRNITLGGDMNDPEEKRMALFSIMVRLNDKVQRIINLLWQNKEPSNEKLTDSLDDIANYANIAHTVCAGRWGK